MATERNHRYLAKIDRRGGDECWPWIAGRNPHGYGIFRGDGEQLAHRHGYRMMFGDIPEGMVVCHSCDNPACQNPAHWFLGTPRDNNDDKMRKGRFVARADAKGEGNENAKLTDDAIRAIIESAKSGSTQAVIADAFGVNSRTIGKVLRGESWSHVTNGERFSDSKRRARGDSHHNAKITYEKADEIRQKYEGGSTTQQELADEYGIAQRTVSRIVRNLAWVRRS